MMPEEPGDLKKSDFYFNLPKNLIAQRPSVSRSGSRMMFLNRSSGKTEHRRFDEIASFFSAGDCLVINDTKVIPARLYGADGKLEILLHERIDENRWEVMVKPGKRARVGDVVTLTGGLAEVKFEQIKENGLRIAYFSYTGAFYDILDQIGETPLPHYITEKPENARERYQTVYARYGGSVAAPTAGLHFTDEILQKIENAGVKIARITLHVGLGTFKPVKTEKIKDHRMHSESYNIPPDQADIINGVIVNGGRVIAVGTTSCRTIESCAGENGFICPGSGKTDIFIYPGYKFRVTSGLLTNFHLPESTLIMLVSAFAGRENVMAAYRTAIEEKYRFYSFGDAMLIL